MTAKLECFVDEKNSGKTVEKILKEKFGISSTLMKYLKHNSRLKRNDTVCRSIDICESGDILTADVSENNKNISSHKCFETDLKVLYEDEFIMVVNKPGNMASHPCPGNRDNSLANAVMYHWNKNGEYHNYHIVNRLDKGTSGLCVVAKNQFAHGVLSRQMKNLQIKKRYFAIVHGILEPNEGSIVLPIKRSDGSVIKRIVSDDGKYAKTNYETIDVFEKFSLIKIETETGRTHQIRVHFSHIGHPLVGDWLYGNGDEEKNLINRQALHFGYLSFFHPANNNEMIFEEKLPNDMNELLLYCEKEWKNE